jgi:simple sugar transport system ATP-binding protein
MHVVAGLAKADAGTLRIGDQAMIIRSARAARQAGIGMVHQHFTSIPALTVWENIALAAEWPIAGARARAGRMLTEQGVALDPDTRAAELSVGLRLQLELHKALASGPKILLLDEPTGVLTHPEAADLFRLVESFTAQGHSVLLITHKLDEAIEHADAITVLRRGRVTLDWDPVEDAPRPSRDDLIVAMLGSKELADTARVPVPRGEVVAAVRELEIRAGEVIGIAGVEGNGQRELLRSIPTDAFIPEDRTTEGLILDFSLTENLALVPAPARGGIDWPALGDRMQELIGAYGIKARGSDVLASSLSGGNQQKVVVARTLAARPKLIVAENPARGLDVGAAREVFERLGAAAAAGAAVIFHSTDLDEVMAWADRVVVMSAGRLIVPPAGADRNTIGTLMVSRETVR